MFQPKNHSIVHVMTLATFATSLCACDGVTFSTSTIAPAGSGAVVSPGSTTQTAKNTSDGVPVIGTPPSPAYCDSFSSAASTGTGISSANGLQGTIKYLDPSQSIYTSASTTPFDRLNGYWKNGVDISIFNTPSNTANPNWNVLEVNREQVAHDSVISAVRSGANASATAASIAATVRMAAGYMYSSQLNIPDQSFDAGFKDKGGSPIMADGSPLNQWFNVEFQSVLQLGSNDVDGYYQFATESDDGVVVQIKDPTLGWKTIIDHTRPHGPEQDCANQSIYLDHAHTYPLDVNYYQGPKVRIALVLYAKFLGSSSLSSSPLSPVNCSFSVGSGSSLGMGTGGQYYVVPSKNFFLPGGALNPCL